MKSTMAKSLMKTYAPLDVTFDHGKGAWLWDTDGNKYLDALSGIAVTGLGHAHSAVTDAICDQAKTLLHTSNLFNIQYQQLLAERLTKVAKMDRVFFGNSGAEANEAAIKIARLFGNQRNISEPAIIVTEASFHGRTLATLSATGNRKIQAGFEPLVKGFVRAPYNDLDALEKIASHNKNVVAIMVEPIQGESGIIIPDDDYLTGIREICDQNNWLMILDEIQTGMGRSGAWFAYQHYNILPDIMTLAKGLGNGMPIGACLAHGDAAEVFQPGNHGSTFGGNPIACRTALAVVDSIENEGLVTRAMQLGNTMLSAFQTRLGQLDYVSEIRGKGLLFAIELNQPCKELASEALKKGIVINVTADNIVRLLPPLIISDEEANMIVERVCELIESFPAVTGNPVL